MEAILLGMIQSHRVLWVDLPCDGSLSLVGMNETVPIARPSIWPSSRALSKQKPSLAVKWGHPGTSGTVSSSSGSSGESGTQVTRAPSPGDIGPASVGSREENMLAGAHRSPNGDGGGTSEVP